MQNGRTSSGRLEKDHIVAFGEADGALPAEQGQGHRGLHGEVVLPKRCAVGDGDRAPTGQDRRDKERSRWSKPIAPQGRPMGIQPPVARFAATRKPLRCPPSRPQDVWRPVKRAAGWARSSLNSALQLDPASSDSEYAVGVARAGPTRLATCLRGISSDRFTFVRRRQIGHFGEDDAVVLGWTAVTIAVSEELPAERRHTIQVTFQTGAASASVTGRDIETCDLPRVRFDEQRVESCDHGLEVKNSRDAKNYRQRKRRGVRHDEQRRVASCDPGRHAGPL